MKNSGRGPKKLGVGGGAKKFQGQILLMRFAPEYFTLLNFYDHPEFFLQMYDIPIMFFLDPLKLSIALPLFF